MVDAERLEAIVVAAVSSDDEVAGEERLGGELVLDQRLLGALAYTGRISSITVLSTNQPARPTKRK